MTVNGCKPLLGLPFCKIFKLIFNTELKALSHDVKHPVTLFYSGFMDIMNWKAISQKRENNRWLSFTEKLLFKRISDMAILFIFRYLLHESSKTMVNRWIKSNVLSYLHISTDNKITTKLTIYTSVDALNCLMVYKIPKFNLFIAYTWA